MTKYTKEARAIVQTSKAPVAGVIMDVVEYENHLALRFYRDNMNRFSDTKQVAIAEWIFELQRFLNVIVPTTIEMEDAPV